MSVLVIALLFFGLMLLLLAESSEAYRSALRFRARITSQANAESAAELEAAQLVNGAPGQVRQTFADGEATAAGSSHPAAAGTTEFQITARGTCARATKPATVTLWGEFDGAHLTISRSLHSQ